MTHLGPLPAHMKAFVYTEYGPPGVLMLSSEPVPEPQKGEMLVRVHATTVNRTDSGFLTGKPWIARLYSGVRKPRWRSLGNEFAGVVVKTGEGVTKYVAGDRVFGFNDWRFGSHAEFNLVKEEDPIAHIPDSVSFENAACATEGAHYALCDIRTVNIGHGSRVLVNGATGAIGSAAVQLCKYLGAEVTAVCATPHIQTVLDMGADRVIDFTAVDFTQTEGGYDFVFDAVGKSTFGRCKRLLKSKGIYISTELGPGSQNPFLALITPLLGGKKLKFPIPTFKQQDALFLRDRLADGSLRPLVDRVIGFEEIPAAFEYVLTGQKIGNVVVTVVK